MPLTAIDASVLRPSTTKTKCPYKGEASYYSVDLGGGKVYEDVVWYYNAPLMESAKIEGMYSGSCLVGGYCLVERVLTV